MIRFPAPFPPERLEIAELMDNPETDLVRLERTLRQFSLVNRLLSRMHGLVRHFLLRDMLEQAAADARDRLFSVLDVGAGACDIPLALVHAAHSAGIRIHVTCIDHDPRVISYARRAVRDQSAVSVVEGSAFDLDDEYDYIMGNHFLHHLKDKEITRFLDTAYHACRRRLLINDLLRSYWSLAGFAVFSAVLLPRSFSSHDGAISIRKGFRPEELKQLVDAGSWRSSRADVQVKRAIPGRVYLVATKNRA